MDIKEEHILGEAINDHWYYVSKGRALRSFLGKTAVEGVLDVGAGSGIFTQKLILMMDVLEHVDDDLALLKEYADPMPSDGRIAITVPAFQWLWSGHDVFLEHRRRYTLAQVEDLVARAGLRVIKGRYFFGGLFPAVAALRLRDRLRLQRGEVTAKSDLRAMSNGPNKALIAFHDLERNTLFHFNRLAGLSVFCLAGRA